MEIGGSIDSVHALVHPDVPELNFTAATATYELALAATLQMYVRYPLTMFFPNLDHCHGGLKALIIDAHSTVTKASNEDLAFDLLGR